MAKLDDDLADLLAQVQEKLGPVARAIVSANAAHIRENPEGGERTALALRDKARSSRRGRGAPKRAATKQTAMVDYLHGGHSVEETAKKFRVKAATVIRTEQRWKKALRQ